MKLTIEIIRPVSTYKVLEWLVHSPEMMWHICDENVKTQNCRLIRRNLIRCSLWFSHLCPTRQQNTKFVQWHHPNDGVGQGSLEGICWALWRHRDVSCWINAMINKSCDIITIIIIIVVIFIVWVIQRWEIVVFDIMKNVHLRNVVSFLQIAWSLCESIDQVSM